LRTTVQKGVEIIEALRGHTTGYAVPQFVIDAPGGGGKVPVGRNMFSRTTSSASSSAITKAKSSSIPNPPNRLALLPRRAIR